jgi:hypothetical protein
MIFLDVCRLDGRSRRQRLGVQQNASFDDADAVRGDPFRERRRDLPS